MESIFMHSIYAQVCVFHETKERGSEFCEKQTNEQTDVCGNTVHKYSPCYNLFMYIEIFFIQQFY